MSQTRNTIELLTTILHENGTSRVKAETFRLAKFNNDESVEPLWRLLFELVYYCEFGKIDSISIKAYSELSTEELVVYVKREMQFRGFFSKEFASLPSDMSSGSRELLLGLGWLLCKENMISRFIKSCTSPIEGSTSALPQEEPQSARSRTDQSEAGVKQDMYSRVQQLLLLNNKLRLSLRTLYTLQRENSLLKHQIHDATYGVTGGSGDRNHLSEMEVYMLRHPQLLKNNLVLLEQDNERLQNLLSWRQHEDIYWKWMGSVLDAKLQNIAENCTSAPPTQQLSTASGNHGDAVSRQPGGSDGMTSPRDSIGSDLPQGGVTTSSQATLQQSHLTLQQAITKYESIVQHLEEAWEDKSSEITDDELDSVLSSIDQELAFQRTNILVQNCHTYLQNSSPEGSTIDNPATSAVPDNYMPSAAMDATSIPGDDYPSTSGSLRGDPSFYYDRKPQNKQVSSRQRLEDNMAAARRPTHDDLTSTQQHDAGHITDIELEISSLGHLVDKLQTEVADKQNVFKEELHSLCSKFQDAVCIPPMED